MLSGRKYFLSVLSVYSVVNCPMKRRLEKDQSKRILICDNEPRTRQALKALLAAREIACGGQTGQGIQVVAEAGDGREALRLVRAYLPEVVVIEAWLPGMDGIQTAGLIKKNWPEVKVVMLTMHPDRRQAALAAGVDAFLIKGCQAEMLFEAILC